MRNFALLVVISCAAFLLACNDNDKPRVQQRTPEELTVWLVGGLCGGEEVIENVACQTENVIEFKSGGKFTTIDCFYGFEGDSSTPHGLRFFQQGDGLGWRYTPEVLSSVSCPNGDDNLMKRLRDNPEASAQ